jgi:hypothetical protein
VFVIWLSREPSAFITYRSQASRHFEKARRSPFGDHANPWIPPGSISVSGREPVPSAFITYTW